MAQKQEISSLTGLFKVLSDETRFRILTLLQNNELAVGELQKILRVGQSALSSQLGLLRDQNLVVTRKEGQKVYYRFSEELPDKNNFNLMCETLKKVQDADWRNSDKIRLQSVLRDRSESTRHFFNSLREQDVIPPGQTWETLAQGLIQIMNARSIVDLGCGTGKLAIMLYRSGKQVVGIDSSKERIKTAQSLLEHEPKIKRKKTDSAPLISFIQADMEETGLPSASADLVLLSQSLHHVANPPVVLKEAFRLLLPGGKILLLDLASHQEDWMRDKFGDFWLGFSEEDVRRWMKQCTFKNISIVRTRDSQSPREIQTLIVSAVK
jgi:ArsR family transcriptional regulator